MASPVLTRCGLFRGGTSLTVGRCIEIYPVVALSIVLSGGRKGRRRDMRSRCRESFKELPSFECQHLAAPTRPPGAHTVHIIQDAFLAPSNDVGLRSVQ